jgi:hypothetical protein
MINEDKFNFFDKTKELLLTTQASCGKHQFNIKFNRPFSIFYL